MIGHDHRRVGGWVLIAALLCVAGEASAQRTHHGRGGGGGGRQRGGIQPQQQQGATFGLGGVKSQPGVRAEAPRPISIPTFGHPVPNSVPMIGRPAPMPVPAVGGGPGMGGHQVPRDSRHMFIPVGAEGLAASGHYKSGPFSLVFSTHGLGHAVVPHDGYCAPMYFGGYSGLLPWGLGSYFGDGSYFSAGYYWDPYYQVGPAPAPAEPAPQPQPSMSAPRTPLEHAGDLLAWGDAKGAIAAYQSYLKQNPNDADAMRMLGLSLIDGGRTADGVAVIGMAYRSDTSLPLRPFSIDVFSGGAAKARQHLNRVSNYANREGSATAWLTLAAFMQAEGRDKQARAMIERARKAGLDPQIVGEMNAALSGTDSQAPTR